MEEKQRVEIKYPELQFIKNKYYFVIDEEKGKKAGPFYNARKFKGGFAIVKKHSWSKWQILNQFGGLSKDSYENLDVDGYQNGYIKVEKEGLWYLRDEMGNLQGDGYKFIGVVTEEGYAAVVLNKKTKDAEWKIYDVANQKYSKNSFHTVKSISGEYAVVVKKQPVAPLIINGKTHEFETLDYNDYYYDFSKGLDNAVFSEEGFDTAEPVKSGISEIKRTSSSDWQLRDAKTGKLSEESFTELGGFSTGEEFARCKQYDGYYHFVDRDFVVSQDCYQNAQDYKNGFAEVTPVDQLERKETLVTYRDMLGRLSNEKTKSGEDFHKYYNGRIALRKLSALHFVDDVFCQGILKNERRKIAEMGRQILDNPDLSIEDKKKKYAQLVEGMETIKEIVEEKKEAGQQMIENKRQDDARRREEERKRKQKEKDNKDAFDDFLSSIK